MGLGAGDTRLYTGPPHRWRVPDTNSPLSFALAALAAFVVLSELALLTYEYLFIGHMRAGTAQLIGGVGVVLFLAANAKSVALALGRVADETLTGFLDLALAVLWKAHFTLAPLSVLSLGLFLAVTPVPQPPFYHIAYGILLWQSVSGALAREALPVPGGRAAAARVARATHRQPAIFVIIAVLVFAGFVDSIFP